MSDQEPNQLRENIIEFPMNHLNFIENKTVKKVIETPIVDQMEIDSMKMNQLSGYKSNYDWEALRSLEIRIQKNPIRGGMFFKTPFKLVNAHSTCQQCLYAFEVDTYGRGCVHNCVYCYAKDQLTSHGYWNNPYPVPIDINEVRKVFYTVFETSKPTKWRPIIEKRTPIRIGSMSDSFMWMDDKFKVTKEFLRILNYYEYPYVIFTRSDLIARDDYMDLLSKKLSSVQFSISSTNDIMNKQIEPGAPSAKRRLQALHKLNANGFWTTVRLNPFFPTHPDGYHTDPKFTWNGPVPAFNYSSLDMIEEIASSNTKSILAGIVRMSPYALNEIQKATDIDYRSFFTLGKTKSAKDFHYSDREIRYYYEQIKLKCMEHKIQFTTCYIGNGEAMFWRDQDLWTNKKDCCNIKGKVAAFKNDSREIPFELRQNFSSHKNAPNVIEDLHKPLGFPKLEPILRSDLGGIEETLPK